MGSGVGGMSIAIDYDGGHLVTVTLTDESPSTLYTASSSDATMDFTTTTNGAGNGTIVYDLDVMATDPDGTGHGWESSFPPWPPFVPWRFGIYVWRGGLSTAINAPVVAVQVFEVGDATPLATGVTFTWNVGTFTLTATFSEAGTLFFLQVFDTSSVGTGTSFQSGSGSPIAAITYHGGVTPAEPEPGAVAELYEFRGAYSGHDLYEVVGLGLPWGAPDPIVGLAAHLWGHV